jgi:hypothetical protein
MAGRFLARVPDHLVPSRPTENEDTIVGSDVPATAAPVGVSSQSLKFYLLLNFSLLSKLRTDSSKPFYVLFDYLEP